MLSATETSKCETRTARCILTVVCSESCLRAASGYIRTRSAVEGTLCAMHLSVVHLLRIVKKRPARHPVVRVHPPRHGMGDGVRSVSARYIDLSGVNTWHGT